MVGQTVWCSSWETTTTRSCCGPPAVFWKCCLSVPATSPPSLNLVCHPNGAPSVILTTALDLGICPAWLYLWFTCCGHLVVKNAQCPYKTVPGILAWIPIYGDDAFYFSLTAVCYFRLQVACRLWASISQGPVSVSFRTVSGRSVTCRTQPPNR